MSITVSKYDNAGRVTGVMTISREAYELMGAFNPPHIIGSVDSATHYIEDGVAVERPVSLVTRSGLTLEGAPVGGELIIDQVSYGITDPVIELSFNLPGKYRVIVRAFPALDYEEELTYAG